MFTCSLIALAVLYARLAERAALPFQDLDPVARLPDEVRERFPYRRTESASMILHEGPRNPPMVIEAWKIRFKTWRDQRAVLVGVYICCVTEVLWCDAV